MRFLRLFLSISATGAIFFLVTLYIFKPQTLHKGFSNLTHRTTRGEKYNYKVFSSKLNDNLLDYYMLSSSKGIKACQDESDLKDKIKNGKLLEVKSGKYYVVEKMKYSYPCLTNSSKLLLDEIGKRFRNKISGTKLKRTRFVVTSMTRTLEINKKLRGVNPNTSSRSPHLNGNAFDITYVRYKSGRFVLSADDKRFLKETLAEIIWQLRKEGKCWATYERSQYCFHVVAK
jgi:hypothetical protein